MSVTEEERQLYQALKDLPDFDCFPIPQRWFKEFNIPPRNPITPAEYIKSNYANKMMFAPKDLPPIIINKPQKDGKLLEFAPPEDIPVEVVSKPFEYKEEEGFPAILPSLTEQSVKDDDLDADLH